MRILSYVLMAVPSSREYSPSILLTMGSPFSMVILSYGIIPRQSLPYENTLLSVDGSPFSTRILSFITRG